MTTEINKPELDDDRRFRREVRREAVRKMKEFGRFSLGRLRRYRLVLPGRPTKNTPYTEGIFDLLGAYDVAYLELAKRQGLPSATTDGNLRKAAQAEGVRRVLPTH